MTPSKFQVYGERCCGTNFVIKLLERNLLETQFTEEFGFKHWFPKPFLQIPSDVLIVHVRRNLKDSLRSLHRKPWHVADQLKNLSFGEFIRTEWHCVWNEDFWRMTPEHEDWGKEMSHERNPLIGDRYPNVVSMRTAKDLHWKHLGERSERYLSIDYDQIAKDPEGTLAHLALQHALVLKEHFEPIVTYKGALNEPYQPSHYSEIDGVDSKFIAEQELEETTRTSEQLRIFGKLLSRWTQNSQTPPVS